MSGGVFINYRGEDTRSYGVLLYRELSQHLGQDRVFLDSESIDAGADFAREILGRVRSCQALLAVIGPHWLTATDPSGQRRIDDPRDWIRRELVEAFTTGTRVIPVLTDDATLPTEEQLPAAIAALAGRQFRRLRHRDAGMDLNRIIADVARSGAGPMIRAGATHNGLSAQTKQDTLAKTAGQLAVAVGTHWRHEEDRRKIQDPMPLPVRWQPADKILTDHPKNILRLRANETAGPLDVSGDLDQIADVYQRIPSRRLVVLGRAGSGKTILALRFVLDLLDMRTAGDAVPVIFSMGSWNPAVLSLEDWLISQLIRDHPGLTKAGTDTVTLAAELVTARWILPVLDGFDEIANGLHHDALQELSATTMPLVLTSRPDEYTAAVAGTPRGLTLAAVIKLTDLTLDDVAGYLPRTTAELSYPGTHAAATTWEPVLGQLRSNPDSQATVNLTRTLTTPLMVALARTIYSDAADRSPATLLDTNQFSTVATLEDHLLSSFIPSVYRLRPGNRHTTRSRRWNPERAGRWLGYLAGHLDQLGTRDLAWWELGTTMRRSSRALVIALLAGMTFAVVTSIGNIPVDLVATQLGLEFALRRGIVVGILHGLVGGLAFGLMYWFADGSQALKPSPVRIRFFGPKQLGARLTTRLTLGITLGFVVALAVILVDRLVVPRLELDDGLGGGPLSALEFALEVGLGTGLVIGFIAWLEAPIDVTSAVSPADLLKSSRMNVIFHMLVWALVFGLEVGIVSSFTTGPLRSLETGLVFGLEGAFAGGLGYGLSLTAWGQWVALSRIYLPLTRRLPWRLIAFLDDACREGVLRQAGAVYQFRHARLQDHLTGAGQPGRAASP